MNAIRGALILFFFFGSIMTFFVSIFEIKETLEARTWEPRQVIIEMSFLQTQTTPEGTSIIHEIEIRDKESGETSSWVKVRKGDFNFNLAFLSNKLFSSREKDVEKYQPGSEVTAYKKPGSNQYVLEQNTITLMVTLLLLSIPFPFYIIRKLIKKEPEATDS